MSIKNALIGYTGFVGANLTEQYQFDKLYNSKNIAEIAGQEIELLICAGVSANKWLANQEPQTDIANIKKLKNHIQKAKIKRFILISTIDVYAIPVAVNEDTIIHPTQQEHYGKHRYQLEQWVASQRSHNCYNIIRLPGLFGKHLKKNFIYDILNPLATSINKNLWQDLQERLTKNSIQQIKLFYSQDEFGNLKQQPGLTSQIKDNLIKIFTTASFSALNFTDSRSSFQFYNLANLRNDINKAIENDHTILNLTSEPITARELVKHLTGKDFNNHTNKGGISYNVYSKYALDNKYLYDKKIILEQIKAFVIGNK